jgi:hypothetical protein
MTRRAPAELRKYAKVSKRRALHEDEALGAVYDVTLLLDAGVIKDDEFNGIAYSYVTVVEMPEPLSGTVH